MGVEYHLSIYDPEMAERKEAPGEIGFSFRGMTVEQAHAALGYTRTFVKKLEEFLDEHQEVRHRQGDPRPGGAEDGGADLICGVLPGGA